MGRRSHTADRETGAARRRRSLQPWLGILAALSLAASVALLELGVPFVSKHFYELAWWSLIGILDALVWRREGRSPLAETPSAFFVLALWSAAFWLVFELLNLRLENWYYVYVPEGNAERWFGTICAYGTVLPAIHLAARLFRPLPEAMGVRAARPFPGGVPFAFAVLGLLSLALPLAQPRWFFPLVWGALFFLLDPLNRRLGAASLLGFKERGTLRPAFAYLAGGLVCGLLWEALNYRARVKWIYTVPYFEELKLFEMPPLGFLGFPPFALECFAFTSLLTRLGLQPRLGSLDELLPLQAPPRIRHAWAPALLAALAMTAVSLPLMERRTIRSLYPEGPRLAAALKERGYDPGPCADGFNLLAAARSAQGEAIPPPALRFLELALHAGIGLEKAARLESLDIRSVADLARADPERIFSTLERGRYTTLAEVRVWVRRARAVTARPRLPPAGAEEPAGARNPVPGG